MEGPKKKFAHKPMFLLSRPCSWTQVFEWSASQQSLLVEFEYQSNPTQDWKENLIHQLNSECFLDVILLYKIQSNVVVGRGLKVAPSPPIENIFFNDMSSLNSVTVRYLRKRCTTWSFWRFFRYPMKFGWFCSDVRLRSSSSSDVNIPRHKINSWLYIFATLGTGLIL